eukprot:11774640-Heterocapsa_arctica.AAC.1
MGQVHECSRASNIDLGKKIPKKDSQALGRYKEQNIEETGSVEQHLVEHRRKAEQHDCHKWKYRRRKEDYTGRHELERQGTTGGNWLDMPNMQYIGKLANKESLSN